ncbi:MAG: hypothetical protein ACK5H2_11585 [Beutenbergiaceae bacterium]
MTLPATAVAVAVVVVGSVLVTLLNALYVRDAVASGDTSLIEGSTSPEETTLAAVPLATVGAVVLGGW